MPRRSELWKTGDNVIHVTFSTGSTSQCSYCHRSGSRLCDYVTDAATQKTCDKPLCLSCTHDHGRNRDLCREHRHITGEPHRPRRNLQASRWIARSLYAGNCSNCHTHIPTGTRIYYTPTAPKHLRARCERCGLVVAAKRPLPSTASAAHQQPLNFDKENSS